MNTPNEELPLNTTFTSLSQCSTATGIPIEILKYATKHKDAVDNSNGAKYANRLHWELLKPWLEKHADDVQNVTPDDYNKWLTLKTKAQAELAQYDVEERRERLIDKEVVHQLLRRISAAQSSLMNSKFRQELIPKMEGKTEPERAMLMDAAINEYMAILNKELDKIE